MKTIAVLIWLKVIVMILAVLVVLYLLMIMPRLTNRRERKKFLNVYYAHRGLHDNETDAPENSMSAFRRAVEAGYGIELDVQVTKDKIPVVFHDFTLQRVCGQEGKVCDYTYEELQKFRLCKSSETIPLFEDVLKLVAGKVPFIVELKVEFTDLSVCKRQMPFYGNTKGCTAWNPLIRLPCSGIAGIIRKWCVDSLRKLFTYREFKGPLYFILQNLLLNFLTKPDFVAYNHKHADVLSRKICRGLYGNMAAA